MFSLPAMQRRANSQTALTADLEQQNSLRIAHADVVIKTAHQDIILFLKLTFINFMEIFILLPHVSEPPNIHIFL